jgi:hypothetical protein
MCSLPVVAEATLSMAQSIEHMHNGFLVLGEEGWYVHLKKLMIDSQRRKSIGEELHKSFFEKNSIVKSLSNFLEFTNELQLKF